ncbi:NrsF family protein [Brevundimonas abyssalis]|nr:NrsF family protein [Brevundimonas abyssalis]
MKTDDLIDALGAGLEPVGPARLSPAALTLAAAAAVVAVLFLLGLRPDLGAAVQGPAFWAKAAYTGALAVVGGWLVLRLGCPGASARPPGLAFAAVVGAALAVGAGEILLSAPDARMDVWLGDTWRYCSANILKVSVFAAPFIWLSARGLAPTRRSGPGPPWAC